MEDSLQERLRELQEKAKEMGGKDMKRARARVYKSIGKIMSMIEARVRS